MESIKEKLDVILPAVLRPGRYVGNELNIIRKDWIKTPVRIALAFPDLYEIGMSHMGMEILYHILNQKKWIAAERVYSPWIDMEKEMRRMQVPLFTLESLRPVDHFDILGISLQYELQYTNVLTLLDLSGIPLDAKERDDKMPFVIAGGPLAFNAEPLAPFLDAIVLGDGEEVVLEIAECIRNSKLDKRSRKETLEALAQIQGVYIPQFYEAEFAPDGAFQGYKPTMPNVPETIDARILEKLDSNNYPIKPLVPHIEVTHDRFSLEIMRGCTRGCRFCQAGMVYRPIRVRSVDELLEQARAVLGETGYDEISLVSLSSSDYPCLLELMARLQSMVQGKNISISFPSLRPETFTHELADFAGRHGKSGLTLAPEAGSQRLRDVINKNNTEEDLLKAVRLAFERGWSRVKLYFMIGLPTETAEDIDGIVDLVGKVVRLSKEFGRKEISVSISPFSPKAHTPFQWERQNSIDEFRDKVSAIAQRIRWKNVKLNWRDPHVSQLEAILGLGGRELAPVILRVWQKGARFDAWTDQFNYERWQQAFREMGVDGQSLLGEKSEGTIFPWDHLSKGVTKSFFRCEYQKAHDTTTTPDCRTEGCNGCGVNQKLDCYKTHSKKSKTVKTEVPAQHRTPRNSQANQQIQLRIVYQKGETVRFTSHLDMIRLFSRAFRRANIPIAMSKGFHVRMKIATGPPLPLGYLSQCEYIDVEINGPIQRDFNLVVNRYLPEGLEIIDSKMIIGKSDSLNSIINMAVYEIDIFESFDSALWKEAAERFLKSNSFKIVRNDKERDIRLFVEDIRVTGNKIRLQLKVGPSGTARVDEILEAIRPHYEEPPRSLQVVRTGLYIVRKSNKLTPLEVI